jgi:hypothetical protein
MTGGLAAVFFQAWLAAAQEASPAPSPAPSPSASPSAPALPPRPIAESVGRVVERYLSGLEPCLPAQKEGVPCFPTEVEAKREESVAEALQRYQPGGAGAPPLVLSPNGTPVVGITFDPFCAAKGLLKAVRGRNDTYYLYRVWDPEGERAMLRERPLAPGLDQVVPHLGYELVAEIHGECEAVAAWRKANREAIERNRSRADRD